MRLKVLDQILAQKYDLKIKIFELWWKQPQAFTQQQNTKKTEIIPSLPSVLWPEGFSTKF